MATSSRKLKGIRIVSDGSIMGTKVYDKNGVDVTRSLEITKIEWTHLATGIPTAVLTCVLAELDATIPDETLGLDVE